MSVKQLQARLNRRLKEVNKGYAVKGLRCLPSGEYWFDLGMAFNSKDLAKVNRIFAEVLEEAPARRETVQAKFYLTPETYKRLKRSAADRGVTQSTLVEQALQNTL